MAAAQRSSQASGPTVPVDQVIQVEAQDKQHLEQLAENVTLATDQKTLLPEIQPIADQLPLTEETQQEAESFHQDQNSSEKISKLSYIIPALQKKVRTTRAVNFLGKKMEWLAKKTGGEVHLKES